MARKYTETDYEFIDRYNRADDAKRRIAPLRSKQNPPGYKRAGGCLGLFGAVVVLGVALCVFWG